MTNSETIEQGIALFVTVEVPARNLAERTRQEYIKDLTDVATFLALQGITKLKEIDRQALERYQAKMDRRGYAASTRNRKTYAIKSFFNFLCRQGMVVENMASDLVAPQPPKHEPRFLSEEEYN